MHRAFGNVCVTVSATRQVEQRVTCRDYLSALTRRTPRAAVKLPAPGLGLCSVFLERTVRFLLRAHRGPHCFVRRIIAVGLEHVRVAPAHASHEVHNERVARVHRVYQGITDTRAFVHRG